MYTVSTVKGFVHTFNNIKDAKACASTASRNYACISVVRDSETCQTISRYQYGHEIERA